MSRFTPLHLGCVLPFALISNAALADLTPQQVWSDWRTYMEGVGYQIAATETASGGNLTVSDINLDFPLPETEGTMSMSLGTISFSQNGDGTVSVLLPDNMPITMSGNTGEAGVEPFTATINITQSGHAMTASGTPDRLTYLYTAAGLAVNLGRLQVGDEVLGTEVAKVSMTGSNLSTSTTMTLGDTRGYDQSGSIESLTYDIFFTDPENNSQAAIKGSVNGLSMTGEGDIPLVITPGADMAAMMAAGFDVAGRISYAAGNANFDVTDPENGNVVMTTSTQGGDFGVSMGPDGLAYDVSQKGVALVMTAQTLPFPVQINMAESGFKLAMPLSKSDTPQDFAFGLTMGDFTMSDMIWSIFDPAGQLPRDPATIAFDLTGKVKMLVDLMNPEEAAQMTGAPGEMQALSLGSLLVSAVGAKLQGSGDFTFDGNGPAMVPGLGNPVGNVNLDLAGANGLIDKLVAMGLLPQEQAMGARMMMGLFAVPGDAPDTLKSRIEFTQDGQILANGQRIR